ncbi:MAG: signal peptidase I [Candidatus Peribacteraceae bacterium]|nr:signal peptidase I [Candidatus Peribacteria bacterium]
MEQKKHSLWYHLADVALNIIIILGVVGVIRTFLVSPFQVEGNSMLPTLEDREYIVINKLVYYLGDPQRGDVVVFRPPTEVNKHYVKRIIGIPGDTIIIRNGKVYIQDTQGNTTELEESYLDEHNQGHTYRHPPSSGDTREMRYTVPENEYFLMGDNRQGSLDSRSFAASGEGATAFVPDSNIKGRVWFVALPISKIHALEPPQYNTES